MVVQLTLDFEVQLLRSVYQKNAKANAIILVQESYKLTQSLLKLSRFSQVQSERERTLGSTINCDLL